MRHYANLLRATLTALFSLAVLTALMLMSAAAQTADLTGVPIISDADTLDIGATRVRLEGIDAPEIDQVCLNATGDISGAAASRPVINSKLTSPGREIICTPGGIDRYKRKRSGKCRVAGEDLNGWTVQQGWALAYVKYSSAYVQTEADARIHLRGLWRGAFIAPWDWRHRNKDTTILGALSVPIDATKETAASHMRRRRAIPRLQNQRECRPQWSNLSHAQSTRLLQDQHERQRQAMVLHAGSKRKRPGWRRALR